MHWVLKILFPGSECWQGVTLAVCLHVQVVQEFVKRIPHVPIHLYVVMISEMINLQLFYLLPLHVYKMRQFSGTLFPLIHLLGCSSSFGTLLSSCVCLSARSLIQLH